MSEYLCSNCAESVTRYVQIDQMTQTVALTQVAHAHLSDRVVVQTQVGQLGHEWWVCQFEYALVSDLVPANFQL